MYQIIFSIKQNNEKRCLFKVTISGRLSKTYSLVISNLLPFHTTKPHIINELKNIQKINQIKNKTIKHCHVKLLTLPYNHPTVSMSACYICTAKN